VTKTNLLYGLHIETKRGPEFQKQGGVAQSAMRNIYLSQNNLYVTIGLYAAYSIHKTAYMPR